MCVSSAKQFLAHISWPDLSREEQRKYKSWNIDGRSVTAPPNPRSASQKATQQWEIKQANNGEDESP
jgi:hypothetical protein